MAVSAAVFDQVFGLGIKDVDLPGIKGEIHDFVAAVVGGAQFLYCDELFADPHGHQRLGTGGHAGVDVGLHLLRRRPLPGDGDLFRPDAQDQIVLAGGGALSVMSSLGKISLPMMPSATRPPASMVPAA